MKNIYKRTCGIVKKSGKRPYNQALKNVISLRVSDEVLEQLTRIQQATAKSYSEIMRDALTALQGQSAPCPQH